MTDRYLDFEELRPTGEASHIPDEKLKKGCGGEPQRQRVATSIGGYPDEPTEASGECQSCGASILAGQTKCRFCLTNHLDNEAASTDGTTDGTLLGIVHLVVESTTFYGAVAKGGAAANLLTPNEAALAVDDYTLLYDLDETPAPQLADRWPSLPAAVQVASAEGEQLGCQGGYRHRGRLSSESRSCEHRRRNPSRDDVEVIWLQLGIHDDEAVARAEAAGLRVVQDRCMKPEHQRLVAAA